MCIRDSGFAAPQQALAFLAQIHAQDAAVGGVFHAGNEATAFKAHDDLIHRLRRDEKLARQISGGLGGERPKC